MKTFVKTSMPWGLFRRNGHRLLFADGVIRAAELAPTADTYFSVPGRARIGGKWVTGYYTTEEIDGARVHCFRVHDVHKKALGFPNWPEMFSQEWNDLLKKGI